MEVIKNLYRNVWRNFQPDRFNWMAGVLTRELLYIPFLPNGSSLKKFINLIYVHTKQQYFTSVLPGDLHYLRLLSTNILQSVLHIVVNSVMPTGNSLQEVSLETKLKFNLMLYFWRKTFATSATSPNISSVHLLQINRPRNRELLTVPEWMRWGSSVRPNHTFQVLMEATHRTRSEYNK